MRLGYRRRYLPAQEIGGYAFTELPETRLAQALREILDPIPIGASCMGNELFATCISSLETFVSVLIIELWPTTHESLDGIYPEFALKSGLDRLYVAGNCVLVSDQTVTPIEIELELSPGGSEVVWCECKLGESERGVMKRTRFDGNVRQVAGRLNQLEWSHHFGFDNRTDDGSK